MGQGALGLGVAVDSGINVKRKDKKPNKVADHKPPASICPQCGKAGPHFVPPIFGLDGFYTCTPQMTVAQGYVLARAGLLADMIGESK